MLKEYTMIFVYLSFVMILSTLLICIAIIFVRRSTDIEKISAYECGFHPFMDTRSKFDVRFYLVAILFIIFDLEISFLFPWSLGLDEYTSTFGFWSMILFIYILLIGFLYEWKKGALDWE